MFFRCWSHLQMIENNRWWLVNLQSCYYLNAKIARHCVLWEKWYTVKRTQSKPPSLWCSNYKKEERQYQQIKMSVKQNKAPLWHFWHNTDNNSSNSDNPSLARDKFRPVNSIPSSTLAKLGQTTSWLQCIKVIAVGALPSETRWPEYGTWRCVVMVSYKSINASQHQWYTAVVT